MKVEIGDLIIGTVTDVKPYAIFMSFEDDVKGLLHISEISDDYIRDVEKYGSRGDQIKVKVLTIDKSNGFLRVSLKRVPPEESYSTHVNGKRLIPTGEKEEFDALSNKLPEWIENTLQEAKKEKKND